MFMKSELYPGINFEHTLDDVLFVEYDQFLSEDYYVNIPYLLENLDILITLRDVVIPNNFIPLKEIRSAVGKRAAEDFNAKKFGIFPMSGIYEWEYRFSRDYHRTIDEGKPRDEYSRIRAEERYRAENSVFNIADRDTCG